MFEWEHVPYHLWGHTMCNEDLTLAEQTGVLSSEWCTSSMHRCSWGLCKLLHVSMLLFAAAVPCMWGKLSTTEAPELVWWESVVYKSSDVGMIRESKVTFSESRENGNWRGKYKTLHFDWICSDIPCGLWSGMSLRNESTDLRKESMLKWELKSTTSATRLNITLRWFNNKLYRSW